MKSAVRIVFPDGTSAIFGDLGAALDEARVSTSDEIREAVAEFDAYVARMLRDFAPYGD